MPSFRARILTFFCRIPAFLPLGVLYVLSDVMAFMAHRVFRYRVATVRDNLRQCFPDKTEKELRAIERRFYRNFTDYVVETVKLLHISDKTVMRRMTFSGVDIMDNYVAQGRDIVVYFSHTGNWEWAPAVRLYSRFADDPSVVFGQIYRPLRSRSFDALMLKVRSRFDTRNIAKKTALRQILGYRKEGRRFIVGFMSDQKPSHGDPTRIVDFFGRPTAVITGTETLARRLDTAVVYWHMSKTGRGRYHIDVIDMTASAAVTAPGQLTARYFSLLQANIEAQPDLWLWTHKRWKTSPKSWDDVDPQTVITEKPNDSQP